MAIDFTKLHGCGNDYIVVDARNIERQWSHLAQKMCQRGFDGVGSDGIALALRSDVADIRMRVINPDGSEAEMSGNGTRLLTKFVIDNGIVSPDGDSILVETLGGIREVHPNYDDQDGTVSSARVSMGSASFAAREVPVDTSLIGDIDEVIAQPFEFGGQLLETTCLSIGNPHAVAVIDSPVAEFPLVEIGSLVEPHRMFPQRINFEVVNVHDRNKIQARVFERGAGETLSSGTGSTASATAARRLGLVDEEVDVNLDGGTMHISFKESGQIYCDGPAEKVFDGVWPEDGD